ncbi:hypothetical protein C8T65DRAFT_699738 [Cerioporus squamosus]|nr:hypothetical protein C8T65DRAFT_699738 [Cerioporus squamosus]
MNSTATAAHEGVEYYQGRGTRWYMVKRGENVTFGRGRLPRSIQVNACHWKPEASGRETPCNPESAAAKERFDSAADVECTSNAPDIIDLTLSEDESPPSPRPSAPAVPRAGKQKKTFPMKRTSKKSRTGSGSSSSSAFSDSGDHSPLKLARMPPPPSTSKGVLATSFVPSAHGNTGVAGPSGTTQVAVPSITEYKFLEPNQVTRWNQKRKARPPLYVVHRFAL